MSGTDRIVPCWSLPSATSVPYQTHATMEEAISVSHASVFRPSAFVLPHKYHDACIIIAVPGSSKKLTPKYYPRRIILT